MFWFATAGLLALGAAFVLLPLLRHYRDTAQWERLHVAANVALYRERVAELEEEHAAGNLDAVELQSLITELQRSLLQDTRSGETLPEEPQSVLSRTGLGGEAGLISSGSTKGGFWSVSRLIPLALVLLMPMLAYGLYQHWGYYDDVRLSGLFKQAIHPSGDPQTTSALVMALKDGVQQYPDNQWAWYFLGRSYSRLGMYSQAEDAFQNATRYLTSEGDRIMAMSQYVLAAFLGADRQLTPEARAMADRVLAINPNELTVLRVLATEAREREDFVTAIGYWRQLVRASPGSSSARVYRSNIAAAENILKDRGQWSGQQSVLTNSAVLEVNVAVAPGLELPPDYSVFVAARNAGRPGMPPLAVAQLTVAELPAKVRLDNSSAVGPFNLSSAEEVYVSALISRQGVANPQPGDYRVVSGTLTPGDAPVAVDLVIEQQVQ